MTSRSSSSPAQVAGQAVVTGLATALLPPARLPARARRSMHVALALGAAGAAWWGFSRAEETAFMPVPARAGLASAFGGLAALSSVGGAVLDARAEQALVRRGARHPRVWMGVGAAVISVATSVVDQRLRAARPPARPAERSA